jgi:hypothetical protein
LSRELAPSPTDPIEMSCSRDSPERRIRNSTNLTVVLFSYFDLGPSNYWTSERSAQKVAIFVDGVALDCSVYDLLHEDTLEVLNDHLLGT